MEASRSSLLSVAIRARDVAGLSEVVQAHPVDYGCRPRAVPHPAGGYAVHALLTPEQLEAMRQEGLTVEVLFDTIGPDRTASATIGVGDRFDGGNRAPRGLGSRDRGDDQDLGGIMNADEVDSAVQGLVNEYGIPTFSPPNNTYEGAGGHGGQIGGVNPDDYHVYFTAGVHARERGGPDNLIYFIADLLYASKHGIGLAYGARSYTHADVLKALSAGIVFYPLVNPDGVRFDQQTDSLWRKNRNPASSLPGDPASIGVDINRNYDFLWDFRTAFDAGVATNKSLASDDPRQETFHGTAPFSEPESRNVAWVFDAFARIRWYMDIHSAAGDVLFSWGDEDDQSDAAKLDQNFLNPAWDRKRGVLDGTGAASADLYREWIDDTDHGNVAVTARRVAGSMGAVATRTYRFAQSVGLYAVSGSSDDYAFSRFRVDPARNKVYGFTMEFGYPANFYPTVAEFQSNVLDTGAGFMEFCLAAVDTGLV